jgi:isoleucyl-tRNA synthetase
VSPFQPVDSDQSFPALEERVIERWRERDVFHESIRRRTDAQPWVFYEGPPTANGRPGSHHVLARVFKDVFPRYRTMRGYRVDRKAGWDCHGLPVELEIERELGIERKSDIERYGIAEFNRRCRDSVFAYIDEWNRLTERIGFWIDTDEAYVTMSNDYIESVWWSLREVWRRGLLYESYKVVPYCPRDGTALSSHEVAQGYRDVVDPSVYVRFPVRGGDGVALLGWTTTPWTLLSNAALAVNPDVTYVRSGDLILAEARVAAVLGETRRSTTASRDRSSSAPSTSRRSSSSATTASAGTRCCRPPSSRPRTAPAWSTRPWRSARTTSGWARSSG